MLIKVLYVVSDTNLYGSNIALLNILSEHKKYNIIPIVVMAKARPIFCDRLNELNVEYYVINHRINVLPHREGLQNKLKFPLRFLKTSLLNYNAANELKQLLIRLKPDIVHTNIGPCVIGYIASKKLNIPHIWHVREYQDLDFGWVPKPSKKKYSERLRTSHTISISNGIKNHFNLNNTNLIYDGVLSKTKLSFTEDKEKYFLFVGRIEDAKGIFDLLEVFSKLIETDNNYILKVAGNGTDDYMRKVNNFIMERGLGSRVELLGYRTDIKVLMRKATALIVPSLNEGFGFITVEAMMSGCLVIGRNSGGTKEILERSKTGLLFNNKEQLLILMKEIINNGIDSYFPQIRLALKEAEKNYTIELHNEKVYSLYRKIIS